MEATAMDEYESLLLPCDRSVLAKYRASPDLYILEETDSGGRLENRQYQSGSTSWYQVRFAFRRLAPLKEAPVRSTSRRSTSPKSALLKLIYFNIFKAISELNKKEGVADYEYYKDKTDYYYDIYLPFFKKRFAEWIAGKEIKK